MGIVRECILLVCKIFGAYFPFGLCTSFSIADRATFKTKFCQKLFATLWCYIAKMVLYQFAVTLDDGTGDYGQVVQFCS